MNKFEQQLNELTADYARRVTQLLVKALIGESEIDFESAVRQTDMLANGFGLYAFAKPVEFKAKRVVKAKTKRPKALPSRDSKNMLPYQRLRKALSSKTYATTALLRKRLGMSTVVLRGAREHLERSGELERSGVGNRIAYRLVRK